MYFRSSTFGGGRLSRRSSATGPSIFAHPGVRTPTAVLDAQSHEAEPLDTLPPVLERQGSANAIDAADAGVVEEVAEKTCVTVPYLDHYGLLSLHSTMHESSYRARTPILLANNMILTIALALLVDVSRIWRCSERGHS
jgi:hypothetical protein